MDNNIFNREHNSIAQTYKRLPIAIKRGAGVFIYDNNGEEYLDFLGGIAVNILGHSHPRIINAIKEQAQLYLHVSNYFYQEPQIDLAERLNSKFWTSARTFFSNSGAEAMEGAIKLARKWGSQNSKKDIIGFTGGFHGRTYAPLSIMDKPNYKEGMGPFLANTKIGEYNSSKSLEELVNSDTCAIILEAIQGEGGVLSLNEDFIETINKLKDKFGFLLIIDEIQAGMGRTGKFFSYEHFGLKPDIVTLSKGLGGGLPLGALIFKEELSQVWQKGEHGTTFGGNALACVCGIEAIKILDEGLMDKVVAIGNYLTKKLDEIKNKYPRLVLGRRGIGLFQGLYLSFPAGEVVEKLLDHKIISNSTSNYVLRIVPPLIVEEKDIDRFCKALEVVFSQYDK